MTTSLRNVVDSMFGVLVGFRLSTFMFTLNCFHSIDLLILSLLLGCSYPFDFSATARQSPSMALFTNQ
jgi:hypothetical protein